MTTQGGTLLDDEGKFAYLISLLSEEDVRDIYLQLRATTQLQPRLMGILEGFMVKYSNAKLTKFNDPSLRASADKMEKAFLILYKYLQDCYELVELGGNRAFMLGENRNYVVNDVGTTRTRVKTWPELEKEVHAAVNQFKAEYETFIDAAIEHFNGGRISVANVSFVLDTMPKLAQLYVEGEKGKVYEMKKGALRYKFLHFLSEQRKYMTTQGLATKFATTPTGIRKMVESIRGMVRRKCKVPLDSIIESDNASGYRVLNVRVIE